MCFDSTTAQYNLCNWSKGHHCAGGGGGGGGAKIVKLHSLSALCVYNTSLELSVLKIMTICIAQDLWKLAQSCKQLCLLMMLAESVEFSRYCLTGWISKLPTEWDSTY